MCLQKGIKLEQPSGLGYDYSFPISSAHENLSQISPQSPLKL
jgi:hypothetical protein